MKAAYANSLPTASEAWMSRIYKGKIRGHRSRAGQKGLSQFKLWLKMRNIYEEISERIFTQAHYSQCQEGHQGHKQSLWAPRHVTCRRQAARNAASHAEGTGDSARCGDRSGIFWYARQDPFFIVTDPIVVDIQAIVARIPKAVAIRIILICIGDIRAIIRTSADTIAVWVI
jgi:hypothetical protein